MKPINVFLLIIAALIAGYLLSKLVRRMRIGTSISTISTATSTVTSTATGTDIGTNTYSSGRVAIGCVPPRYFNGMANCPTGKTLKQIGNSWQCC